MNSSATIASVSPVAATPGRETPPERPAATPGAERAQARYRLVIEEGPSDGSFVYKTLDRVTGEVIRQFPREQVMRLAEGPAYGPGAVISTTA